ncbi:MAG: PAS domain S-box protein [Sedimentisphaerales bacterium]|nr:PAS domain S-box protein [Sedimentisphaerales bacterium]
MEKKHEHNEIWLNIVNSFSDVVVLTDIQGNILKINKAGESFLGVSSEKIIGKLCCKLFHGSKKHISDCPMQKMLQTGQRSNSEHCLSGEKWISITVEPIKDEKGEIKNAVHIIRDITQQKQLEKTLKDSEEKFKSIFENATDAITYLDCRGKILDVNKQVVNLRNGSKEEVINRHFSNINVLSLKDIPKYLKLFKSVLTGEKATVTVEVYNKKREKRFLECSATLIKYDSGPARIMVISRDITDRKITENMLRESEQRLRSIIDHSIEMFYIHDTSHQLTYVSPQCKDILDYTPEEMMVKWTDLVTDNPINIKGFELTQKAIKTGKRQKSYLLEIRRKDGKCRIVEIDESPLKDNKGKVVGITGALRDITEHKHVADAFRESEEKFKNLAEQSPNMIFINKKGKVVYTNKRSSEILGYERDEFYSDDFNFLGLIAPESIEKITNAFTRHLNEQEIEPYEYALITKEGQRIEAIITTKLIDYEGSKSILGIITDITERKKVENSLRKSEEKWRLLYENLPGGSFVVNKDYIIEDVNDILCILTGFKREELVGQSCGIICPKGPHKCPIFDLGKIRIDNDETAVKTKDGQLVPILKSARKIPFDDKEVIVESFQDITERKKADEELKNSEARYHSLFNNANDSIFIMDFDKIIECNNKTLEIFRCSSDRIIGKKPYDPFSPKFQPDGHSSKEKAIEKINLALNGQSQFFEWYHLRYDGTPFYAEISLSPIELIGKTYIQALVRDISERKKAEESLQKSEYNLLEAQRIAHIGSWALQLDTGVVTCSDEMLRIWGYDTKKRSVKYEEILERIHYEDRDRVRKAIYRAMTNETGYESVFRLVLPDQSERIIYGLGHVEKDSEGKPCFILGTGQDITERKKAEENILKYQKQLKSLASQLTLSEEKERHRIATELHDHISQYLAVSMMKLDELLNVSDSEEKRKIIEQINEWLQYAMEESHTLTFDLSSPVLHELGFERAVAAWLEDEVQGKHQIKTEFKSDGLLKPLDEDICVLLFRSVREILFNVIKHAQANKVKVFVRVIDNNIKIQVEDDGVGFKPDEVAANAFVQSKFGLFSIQERLEHFGGNIEIDSNPGGGCRITLIAPLKE